MTTSKADLRRLIDDLSNFADQYDENDPSQRFALHSKANQISAFGIQGFDVAFTHVANMFELVAIRTLISVQAFKHIPLAGSISLRSLLEQVKVQDSLLERLLRIVVCTGLVYQNENLEYEHTVRSREYRELHSPQAFFLMSYDECFLALDRFHLYLAEKGYKEPDTQTHCPYTWAENAEGQAFWDIMSKYPSRMEQFQVGCTIYDDLTITGGYDLNQLNTEGDRPILVDLGGSMGHEIGAMLKEYPNLPANKFILQDLEGPIQLASQGNWLPTDVKKMVADFWQEQPIKGAKAYYFRRVIHDYSDEVCCKIFENLKPAMAPDSVILIVEKIPATRADVFDIGSAVNDIGVMTMAGKNRTVDGYKALFQRAGLELVKIWDTPGHGSLIEVRFPQ